MYLLFCNYKETENNNVLGKEYYLRELFRTRKSAVHYLLDIILKEYKEKGYGTEQITGGAIHCYKSELTEENKRKVIEWTISVEKV